MKLKQMEVSNLRALKHAEFNFHPAITLIVGVNGVGKSTLLDALRICASRILPSITKSRSKAISFSIDDIRIDAAFLDVEVSLEHDSQTFGYTRRQWREKFANDDVENIAKLKRKVLDAERLRDRARNLLRELDDSQGVFDTDSFSPSLREFKKHPSSSDVAPNCIFFSTSRGCFEVKGDGRRSGSIR